VAFWVFGKPSKAHLVLTETADDITQVPYVYEKVLKLFEAILWFVVVGVGCRPRRDVPKDSTNDRDRDDNPQRNACAEVEFADRASDNAADNDSEDSDADVLDETPRAQPIEQTFPKSSDGRNLPLALRAPNKKRVWDAVVVDGVYGETFGQ